MKKINSFDRVFGERGCRSNSRIIQDQIYWKKRKIAIAFRAGSSCSWIPKSQNLFADYSA